MTRQGSYEELWTVDIDDDANTLLKLGWKFIRIIHEETAHKVYTFWGEKTIGTIKLTKFLMGRPKGVTPRQSWENLYRYKERLESESK